MLLPIQFIIIYPYMHSLKIQKLLSLSCVCVCVCVGGGGALFFKMLQNMSHWLASFYPSLPNIIQVTKSRGMKYVTQITLCRNNECIQNLRCETSSKRLRKPHTSGKITLKWNLKKQKVKMRNEFIQLTI
jgi:site-specific DNA-adenine methylase